jgi:hypothetical protein
VPNEGRESNDEPRARRRRRNRAPPGAKLSIVVVVLALVDTWMKLFRVTPRRAFEGAGRSLPSRRAS